MLQRFALPPWFGLLLLLLHGKKREKKERQSKALPHSKAMKRTGGLFEVIAERDNLRLAFVRAARGKRHQGEVRRFAAELEVRLRRMAEQLSAGTFPVGSFQQFVIRLQEQHRAGRIGERELQERATALVAFTQAEGVSAWCFRRAVLHSLAVGGHRARTGCSGAAAGTTTAGTAGRRTATGTLPATGTRTSASGSP